MVCIRDVYAPRPSFDSTPAQLWERMCHSIDRFAANPAAPDSNPHPTLAHGHTELIHGMIVVSLGLPPLA